MRWSVEEVDCVDVALKLERLERHRLQVHLAVFDRLLDFFDGLAAGLVFALDSDHDPVVEYVKDLERLA